LGFDDAVRGESTEGLHDRAPRQACGSGDLSRRVGFSVRQQAQNGLVG
jgi:hypothetical protein